MPKSFTTLSHPVSDHMLSLFGSIFLTAANTDEPVEDFPKPTESGDGGDVRELEDIVNWMEFMLEARTEQTVASDDCV